MPGTVNLVGCCFDSEGTMYFEGVTQGWSGWKVVFPPGIAAAVWAAFRWCEESLNKDTKSAISMWLKNVHPTTTKLAENWASAASSLIDRLFGPKPLSWRFILRSLLVTLIASALVSLVGTVYLTRLSSAGFLESGWELLALMVGVVVLCNAATDYFALILNRHLIRVMAAKPSGGRLLACIVLDVLLTICIAAGPVCGYAFVAGHGLSDIVSFAKDQLPQSLAEHVPSVESRQRELQTQRHQKSEAEWEARREAERKANLPTDPNDSDPAWGDLGEELAQGMGDVAMSWAMSIVFYSALFPSIWVWLYFASSMVVKLATQFDAGARLCQKYLELDEHPLGSLGKVIGLGATLCYGLVYLSGWLVLRHRPW
jgi:hypothetical protein